VHNLTFDQLGEHPATAENRCLAVLAPELAKSWQWVDPTTLEVKLEQGVRFHDKPPVNGRELVASDVAFSYKRLAQFPNWLQGLAKRIQEVEVVDKYTVRFHSAEPFPLLPDALFASNYGSVIVAPEAAAGPDSDYEDPAKSYIGTGPFIFKEWLPAVKVAFERNPAYWRKGMPYVDGIDLLILPDASTRTAAFRAGKLDLWPDELPQLIYEELAATLPHIKTYECVSGGGTIAAMFYLRTDRPPLNDVRVRRAISMAIDRQALITAVYRGKGVLLGLFPPIDPVYLKLEDFPPEIRKYGEYHPKEAKQLLAEAGYPDGLDIPFMVTKKYGPPYTDLAEAMGSMLAEVGIRPIWQWYEYGLYKQKIVTGEFDAIAVGPFTAWNVVQTLTRYHSQAGWALNRSRVVDPEMDKYVDQYLTATSEALSREAARKIQLLLVDKAYIVTGPMGMDFAVAQPYVFGYVLAAQSGEMNYATRVWIER